MSSPKISIIVPVYKTAKYLRKCVNSILGQSFQDFEIILVSEGLEDDDRVCKEFVQKDKRVLYLENTYKGLGGARNTGLDIASGELISFIDSDDYIEPDFLARMLDGINQGADIAQCGTNIVYESRVSLKQKLLEEEYFAVNRNGLIFLDNNLYGTINVGSWNKLYKKRLIEQYDLRFPEGKRNEDAYFTWAYWAVCENMYCIPDRLYNYLRRSDSLMAKTFAKNMGEFVLDHLDIVEEFYNFLIQNCLYSAKQEAFFRAYIISYFFVRDNASLIFREIGHQKARAFLRQIDIPESFVLLKQIAKYSYREFSLEPKNKFSEKIFSIKESYNQKHKILTVCGVKLKLKNK